MGESRSPKKHRTLLVMNIASTWFARSGNGNNETRHTSPITLFLSLSICLSLLSPLVRLYFAKRSREQADGRAETDNMIQFPFAPFLREPGAGSSGPKSGARDGVAIRNAAPDSFGARKPPILYAQSKLRTREINPSPSIRCWMHLCRCTNERISNGIYGCFVADWWET